MIDGYQLISGIGSKKPRYDIKYRSLIDSISQRGDASGNGDFSTFGAFYQTFMYAYILGLHLVEKHGLEKEYLDNASEKVDFAPISQWKPTGVKDFIMMTLVNRSTEFRTPFDWMALENSSDENINNFTTQLVRELEAYANVGFKFLQDKWDNERIKFSDPFVFVTLLSEVSKVDS